MGGGPSTNVLSFMLMQVQMRKERTNLRRRWRGHGSEPMRIGVTRIVNQDYWRSIDDRDDPLARKFSEANELRQHDRSQPRPILVRNSFENGNPGVSGDAGGIAVATREI